MNALVRGHIITKPSPIHGFGVFADQEFMVGDLIEQCHILIYNDYNDRLKDYTFNVSRDTNEKSSGLPLGYGCIYNHSSDANATYQLDEERLVLNFYARVPIKQGEEIFISYGEDWFSSRGAVPLQSSTWYRVKKIFRLHQPTVKMALVIAALLLTKQLLT